MRLEIFSDIICPWCFIMKRQLDRVREDFAPDEIKIRWRPYQLYPGIPLEGVDRKAHLQSRYGEKADANRIPEGIQMAALEVGLEFNFDAMRRIPNTLKAHCLMEFAFAAGCQHQLAESLFEQHFCLGGDVGDPATLVSVAAELGMESGRANACLESRENEPEVLAQLERARSLEIAGVPCILIEERFRIPGAQGMDTLGQLLRRAKERLAAPVNENAPHA